MQIVCKVEINISIYINENCTHVSHTKKLIFNKKGRKNKLHPNFLKSLHNLHWFLFLICLVSNPRNVFPIYIDEQMPKLSKTLIYGIAGTIFIIAFQSFLKVKKIFLYLIIYYSNGQSINSDLWYAQFGLFPCSLFKNLLFFKSWKIIFVLIIYYSNGKTFGNTT